MPTLKQLSQRTRETTARSGSPSVRAELAVARADAASCRFKLAMVEKELGGRVAERDCVERLLTEMTNERNAAWSERDQLATPAPPAGLRRLQQAGAALPDGSNVLPPLEKATRERDVYSEKYWALLRGLCELEHPFMLDLEAIRNSRKDQLDA